MRILDPYAPHATYKKIIQKYGGEYSFFEKLRMGGVGSPRVSYQSGIPEFDVVHHSDDLEQSMTNFELVKKGLIIRINKKQNLAVAIEHLELLKSVTLTSNKATTTERTGKVGTLWLEFQNYEPLYFKVGKEEYKGVQRFFEKSVFAKVYQGA
ncbi:MAG: hypothetical protein AB8F74_08570 [Saprospiraceae bacterium]